MKDTLELKHSFENIKNLRSDIQNIFDTIKAKSNTLNKVYEDMIKAHCKSEYMFGIDSFHFQNELITSDYENMLNSFKKINNRMYCEYYQLYVLIRKYIESDITNDSLRSKVLINKKFPVYKVLDTHRVYRFAHVIELHDYITNTIVELESYRIAKDAELATDTQQSKQGLNIGNLVNSYRYSNALLCEKIKMFVRYLKVFHQHHKKYLTRLSIKTKLIIGIINEDIIIKQLNSSGTSNNNTKKQNLSDEESILKYVGDNENDNINHELTTIVSNISKSEDGSDDELHSIYTNSSNSTITTNKSDNIVEKPVEAEPVEAEPVEAEPVEAEPVDVDPVEAEPVDVDPVEAEPVEAEPVDVDPVEAEPVDVDPVEAEPVEVEPVDVDPVEADPVEADPVEADPLEEEPMDTELVEELEAELDEVVNEDNPEAIGGCFIMESDIGQNDINKKTSSDDVMCIHDNSIKLIVTDNSNNAEKIYPQCL